MSNNLQDVFIKPEERENTQEEINLKEENAKVEQSRLIVFLTDVLDEFENKHRSTAGCLYSIIVSFFLGLLAYLKTEVKQSMPLLEMIFVSTLVMFVINFHLITNSNILPYIKDDVLNTTVKKTGLSFMSSVVLFVTSLQYSHPEVNVFCFLSAWFFGAVFEKYYHNQTFDQQEILMGFITWGGLAFALNVPQLLLISPGSLSINGMIYGLAAGIILVYSGETLRQLQNQNIFTITHVIGLLTIIFLPLFFPIEGLKSPTLMDWIFFGLLAFAFLVFIPVVVKAFTVERQSLVLHYLSWTIPFYFGFEMIFSGKIPSFFIIGGSGAIVVASLILLSFQKVRIHSSSFYIEREKTNPDRPKNDVELNLWTSKAPM